MFKKQKVTRTQDEITDILCNICGHSCAIPIGGEDVNLEAVTISNTFGYGSPRDTETHEAHVCERCYDNLIFPLFTLSPIKTPYVLG